MAIEFNSLSSNQTSASRNKPGDANSPSTQSKSSAGGTQAPPKDTVRLSDAAQAIQSAGKAAEGVPDVNAARVAEIKAAIADGSYSINNEKLADKLLQFDKLFA
jgi:negative regulator of flagellin synthesis FlgM